MTDSWQKSNQQKRLERIQAQRADGQQRRLIDDAIIGGPATPPTQPVVKVFGSMLAAIQRRREEQIAQLWLLMRYYDERGCGRLPREGIKSWNYLAWPNMRRVIREGIKAGYFRSEDDYLGYVGEARLAVILGIGRVTGKAVEIPIDELMASNIVDLRALFTDAYHSSRGDGFNNPISRGGWLNDVGIKAATGKARQTQRRYEKRRGIAVKNNYADFGQYSADELARLEDMGLQRLCVISIERGARKRIVTRLSNRYCGTLATAARSRRWLNRRIMRLAGRVSTPCVIEHQHDEMTVRRYYDSPSQAVKHHDEAINHVTCVYGWMGETSNGTDLWAVTNVTGY